MPFITGKKPEIRLNIALKIALNKGRLSFSGIARPLTAIFAAILLCAQQMPDVTIPIDVIRARVDVRVARKHSVETVGGLAADDFRIWENGSEVAIKGVDRESVPVDLVMMLDVSDSLNHVADGLVAAANDVLSTFSPQDRIAVVEYGSERRVLTEFTTDRSKVKDAIQQARLDVGKMPGATATYDCVGKSVDLFEGPPPAGRRRAVLVVTDDIDNQSHSTTKDVISAVLEKDAVLNAVIVASPLASMTKAVYKFHPGRFILPFKSLKKVAAETGGEFLSGDQVAPLIKQALERIRTRYLITYVPGPAIDEGCTRISTELSRSAKKRYPDAIVYGPRFRMGSQSARCKW